MTGIRGAAIAGAILLIGGVAGQIHTPALASSRAAQGATKMVLATEKNNQYLFSPKTVTVKVGTKVTWKNTSDAAHTVTGTGAWQSYNKQLPAGKSVSFTFTKAGTYHYFCAIHPYMKAKIVVKM